jgi:hypothetical protein
VQLKYISESHFQDIIEERAISLNCGYPMCQKKLKNIPSQQYHISTKMNKVYDLTERKVMHFVGCFLLTICCFTYCTFAEKLQEYFKIVKNYEKK